MYNEWSLDVFYKGADDPALDTDLGKLEETVSEYKTAIVELDPASPAASLRRVINIKESMGTLVRRLMGFFSLRRSANSSDTAGAVYMTKIQGMMASLAKENVAFNKFVGSIEDIDAVIAGDEVLCEYKFYFGEIKKSISHTLSDEAEEVLAKLNISGGRAWGDLFCKRRGRLQRREDYAFRHPRTCRER